MAEDDSDAIGDDALVREAKADQDDAVAAVMRANVRRRLLDVESTPTKIGRFTVLDTIGSGAMGTVFAAYDPVLDRKVAIKLLRETGPTARGQLLDEARALAKLTHPNVVTVHEADVVGERVYIAMEFVQGDDLHGWLEVRQHPWPQVVAVMLAAARGLAAAHRAGLIHRDFKPRNVLVGGDDDSKPSVRVADFGMATVASGPGAAGKAEAGLGGGTYLYMAPERLDGEPATERSDQFAFAVTLFQCVYGRRPFEAPTVLALAEAMRTPVEPPRRADVPPWLERVIARGLSRDPADRFPSMEAVVAALAKPPRRAPWGLIVGAVAVVTAATTIAYRTGAASDPCADVGAAADAVWTPGARAEVRATVVAIEAAFVEDAAERVVSALDAYAVDWAAYRREVCEASRVRHEQGGATQELRVRCLERRLAEVGALINTVKTIDNAAGAAKAVAASRELTSLSRCDVGRVTALDYGRPDDPTVRDAVDALRSELDHAWAQFGTGRYPEAVAAASEAVTRAEALGYAPLTAEARHVLGMTLGRGGDPAEAEATLRQAMLEAADVANDRLAGDVAIALLRAVMFSRDATRVLAMADFARAAVTRAGISTHEVDGIVGEARLNAGDAEGAVVALRAALAAEPRSARAAIVRVNLGSASLALGEADAAMRHYREALDTAVEHFGPAHPRVGFFLQRLGRGQRATGDLQGAHATLSRALALRSAALGDDDRAVASTLLDLARVELERGALSSAETHATRAMKIRVAVYGDAHPRVAEALVVAGEIRRRQGDPAGAVARLARARVIRVAQGAGHATLVSIDAQLAAAHADAGDVERSRSVLARARASAGDLPSGHPARAAIATAAERLEAAVP